MSHFHREYIYIYIYQICFSTHVQLMSSGGIDDDQEIGEEGAPNGGISGDVLSSLFLTQREKLVDVNTLEQCVDLIDQCENIIVLTGAGCSVSCGIPDFRSRDGVYARLRVDFPDLPDPQAMFDICYLYFLNSLTQRIKKTL